jgi:hypothetical protein
MKYHRAETECYLNISGLAAMYSAHSSRIIR